MQPCRNRPLHLTGGELQQQIKQNAYISAASIEMQMSERTDFLREMLPYSSTFRNYFCILSLVLFYSSYSVFLYVVAFTSFYLSRV